MSKHMCREAIFVALGLIGMLSAKAQDLPEVIDRARPSVVTVIAFDKAGRPYSLGSGCVVREDGVVVTAWHVINNAASVKIKFTDGKTIKVLGTYAVDKAHDFAKQGHTRNMSNATS
jgi:S1-C subfamily serine protease